MTLFGGCVSSVRQWRAQDLKPGKPALDSEPTTAAGSRPSDSGAVTSPPKFGVSRPATNVALTVEERDSRLSAALVNEIAFPTAVNHLRVAAEYRRLGIFDFSARHIDQAIAVAPRLAEAHEALAQLWRDMGYPDQGLGAAYRAVFYAHKSASAENTLGTILAALGRADDARRAYERALQNDPSAAWVLNNLCDLERRADRLDTAVERCLAAIKLDPDLKAAHNNLGLTFAALRDLPHAREEFVAAADEATASYNIGLVHMAEGNYRAAAEAFENAIKLRPTFTAAKRRAHAMRLYLLTSGK
jgi:tetratricopeptide (TPR) repeat protein